MSASSSTSTPRSWNHDVFLSFRGQDTRENFTDDLYNALIQAGIYTFRDDDELPRGQNISSHLLKAIEESRIAIIVFSRNYASSGWCLDELAKIMECKGTKGQLVFPVFYGVDPIDVSGQTGSFAEAFRKHEGRIVNELDKVKVGKWRDVLAEAANLSGWHLPNVADGIESKFIQNIIEKVLVEVDHKPVNVSMHPVGIYSRVEDINSLLSIGSHDVRLIGIFGMGGIGKTTIAKAVYNQIYRHFEDSCFFENVKDFLDENDLQEQLLSRILKTKKQKVGNANHIDLISAMLRSRKVLLVLDDVDKLSQINTLAGQRDWFGSGSRIIITTRDEYLLNQAEVDGRYEVKLLDNNESLDLFSRHAFRNSRPLEDFTELSDGVVAYAGGLPLALEVLGAYLLGRTAVEWESALAKLRRIPHNQIQEKLKISFDALEDDNLKEIFLDIACFFIEVDKHSVVTVLNACGFQSEFGLRVLIHRRLLTINDKNKLLMHDLIRDMGREIVNKESPKEPGKRSRLWFRDDVRKVLEKHKGTEAVKGIVVEYPLSGGRQLSTKAFEKMEGLRLLQIVHAHLTGSFEHLPKHVKWLCWDFCPLNFLPSEFHPAELVVLDLKQSRISRLWYGIKYANNLKILNLNYCDCLSKTPDFTGLPRLEKLLLKGCTSLLEIHPSIGTLSSLTYLTLKGCENLRNLPSSICELRLLEYLNISGCSKLDKFLENMGNMESLRELSASGTAIRQLPESFLLLKNLRSFSLKGYSKRVPAKSWLSLLSSWVWRRKSPATMRLLPPSVSGLSSLEKLVLRDCNLPDGGIPFDLGGLSMLKELDLAGNSFSGLPFSLSQLSKLEKLSVNNCKYLQSLPELPCNILKLMANGCSSMEKLPNISNLKQVPELHLANCSQLADIPGLENLNSARLINLADCGNLATALRDTFFQGYSEYSYVSDMYLPKGDIPDWFHYQREGPLIDFDMPLHVENKLKGITFWAVYDMIGVSMLMHFPIVVIKDKTNGAELERWAQFGINPTSLGNHSWVSHIPLSSFKCPIKGGESIEIFFKLSSPLEMKKCAVHLVYKPIDIGVDPGHYFSVNADPDTDDLVKRMHLKSGGDIDLVETSNLLSDAKRLRLELDPTMR